MSAPDIGRDEIDLVNQVLHSPVLSMGPMIERFEALTAEYVGVRHAAAVSSGTAGLHLCVLAAGIGAGDEVITTPFSFVSSANCILYERAHPCFVDVDPVTGNIDPTLIEEQITPKTRAILPVHVFGQPADMDPILDIARRHHLVVIEDSCEAVGAEYKGRRVGTFGDAAVLAYYPNKQMTTGEGGMVLTNRPDWDAVFRSLRNQGRDAMNGWLVHSRLGFNYRLSELAAALGVAQVQRLTELLARRDRVADAYTERLKDVEGVTPPITVATTTRMSWFVYVVRLDRRLDRDHVMRQLANDGISTRPYFSAIHLQPFYREQFGYKEGTYPTTEQLAMQSLALPFHGNLRDSEIDYVCERLKALVR
jgi:perosamine synthetase